MPARSNWPKWDCISTARTNTAGSWRNGCGDEFLCFRLRLRGALTHQSVEARPNSKPRWPRGALVYHAPRGQCVFLWSGTNVSCQSKAGLPAAKGFGFPSPTNARNQLLDSSARKSLILKGSIRSLCGLPALWPGPAGETNGQERSECGDFTRTHLSGEVRKNPREPAQACGSAKKKTNRRAGWSCVLVELAGIEPASASLL